MSLQAFQFACVDVPVSLSVCLAYVPVSLPFCLCLRPYEPVSLPLSGLVYVPESLSVCLCLCP